ncbi:MAG: DUF4258 domain-containing protein [Anaerolineae bacterium]|nr:DUF4258 domain-containing protein [Anaerolineae bacterium]
MEQRAISREMVLAAVQKPDKTYPEVDGDTKFIRKVHGSKVHVVCKPLPKEDKWLVKSVWIRGEDDSRRPVQYKRFPSRRPSASRGRSESRWIFLGLIVLAIIFYLLTR